MLVLTFRVNDIPYAVPVRRVVEVVPRVELRAIPHAPDYLAGLLRYRGGAVPVVDLGLLMGEVACPDRLDTRIILVEAGLGDGSHPLGLIAREGRRCPPGGRVESGGRVAGDWRGSLPGGGL